MIFRCCVVIAILIEIAKIVIAMTSDDVAFDLGSVTILLWVGTAWLLFEQLRRAREGL